MICKILWFSIGVNQAGGAERVFLEGLSYFSKIGVDARLYTAGVRISEECLYKGKYKVNTLNSKTSNFYNFFKIAFEINQFSPDVILANSRNEAVLLMFAKPFFKRKIKIFTFIHGSFFQYEDDIEKYAIVYKKAFLKIWQNDPIYQMYISKNRPKGSQVVEIIKKEIIAVFHYFAVRQSSGIFVLTEKTRKEVILLNNIPPSKVFAIAGAFSKNIFSFKPKQDFTSTKNIFGNKIIFSLGRLATKKKVDLVIKAFSKIKTDDALLLIGGVGPEEENLRNLVKKLKLEKKVQFLGFIKEEDLLDYYYHCNIFVNMDIADYDITTMTALALSKKAVVSSQHIFETELEKSKILFKAFPEENSLKTAFEKALESRNIFDKSAVSVMKKYSWDAYFLSILKIIEEFKLLPPHIK